MPLYPPVADTLRWGELVRQGRAQLPLVAPDWTDQNTSDPGIALLELISWLVEADSYRASAVTDRERRLLLSLAGVTGRPARAARSLIRLAAPTPRLIPDGFVLEGNRDGDEVPFTLVDEVAVTGATIAAIAWTGAEAEADDYRTATLDLTREAAAGRVVRPLGPDPASGDAVTIGLDRAGGLAAGSLDLWFVSGEVLDAAERIASGARHHAATIVWEYWQAGSWQLLDDASVDDRTAALSRSGRVRLELPALIPDTLGDPVDGVFANRALVWVRARNSGGRHDAAPAVAGIYVDAGQAAALRVYATEAADVDQFVGIATGVPDERMRLPHPWCDAAPELAYLDTAGRHPIRVVGDLVLASPQEVAAVLDPDGLTIRFGDGRRGARLPADAEVRVAGTWTTVAGTGGIRPPIAITLAEPAAGVTAELVAALTAGEPAEDTAEVAARAEGRLWVHDRISGFARKRRATSLDDLPLETVRRLGRPERAVTALDFERVALATPGVALARARALPQVDPRLPGLVADGCITVVIVPWIPLSRPEPTAAALRRVRAELEAHRTVGTRVFVVGPRFAPIRVEATLSLRPGARDDAVVSAATDALRTFLHPVSGGPSGRGWPFGRDVHRSEVLQLLDGVTGVDSVSDLVLMREGAGCASCGDLSLGATELAIAGTVALTTAPASGRRTR